jgi:6-phosphogluconolactonase/glucosamine-6-phosphate isomerase/deaminase
VLVVQDSPKPPSLRLSLSLPFLQTASRAILLATGEAKRGVLLRLREGDPSLPAAHLPNLDVVTDLRLA